MSQPQDLKAVEWSIKNRKWLYRGEGNANIAISLPLERKILRFPKSLKDTSCNDLDSWRRLKWNEIFITSVMKPLLGSIFVSPPSLVYVSKEEIDELNTILLPLRPENRKHKVLSFCGAELCDDHAFLTPEISSLCFDTSLCIELKLKQGSFPSVRRRLHKCAFCCKQEWKLAKGKVCERSLYCPLDLFSGIPSRMKHAVKSLFLSPQNNLRVFCDGNVFYEEGKEMKDLQRVLDEWFIDLQGTDSVERFTELLLQALTLNFDPGLLNDSNEVWKLDGLPHFDEMQDEAPDIGRENEPFMPEPFCNYDKCDLPQGCILYRLREAQSLDVCGNTLAHRMLIGNPNLRIKAMSGKDSCFTNFENFSYVDDIVRKGGSSKLNPIELYLIAAAVRDCSILISLQKMREDVSHSQMCELPYIVDKSSKRCYLLKISAVDIDPKPLSCIISHFKKDADTLNACFGEAV